MDSWLVKRSISSVSSIKTRERVVRVAAFFAIVKFSAFLLVAIFEKPVTAGTWVVVLVPSLLVKLKTHLLQGFRDVGLAQVQAPLALSCASVVLQVPVVVASWRADDRIPEHDLRGRTGRSVARYASSNTDQEEIFDVGKSSAHLLGEDCSPTETCFSL
ncbi:hypothetical protein PSPO01_15829 [Paraphaeosphaeria sporulosa]